MRSTKSCVTIERPVRIRFAFYILLIPLVGSICFSQETTLHSRSNLVLVPTLVKDQHGEIVFGLQSNDFTTEDNGVEQTARLDEAPEGQPVSLVLAIQRGRRASYEFPRMQGLRSMVSPIFVSGTSRLAIVEFDSRVDLVRNFTSDEALVDADLSNLQQGDDGAAILDAITESIKLLREQPDDRLRVLLLISETRDHGSRVRVEDAVSAVGQANATLYALAFSPGLSNILDTGRGVNTPFNPNAKNEMHSGANFLDLAYRAAQAMRKNVPSTVASMTGGEYELFATRRNFEVRMNDFANHQHSRYLLSFVPKDPHPGLHQVRVRLKDGSKRTVLSRTTYWAEDADKN